MHVRDILAPERNNFTLLRLLAALAVVVAHAVFLRSGNKADDVFVGASVYRLGDHAVNVFFVLSGLTVAASLSRSNDVVRFLTARALRIFPGLIVCTAALVVLGMAVSACGPLEYLADASVAKFFLKTVSLSTGAGELPGVFESNPYPSVVNASLWTLKFEMLCYVLLALASLTRLFDQPKMALLLPAGWFVAAAFLIQRFGGPADQAEQFARFWLSFSFGVGLFVFRDRIPVSWVAGAGLAAMVWISLGSGVERVLSPIATGYGALLLGSLPLPGLREFTNRTDLSYGVYIFGWPISQTLVFSMPQITASALVVQTAILAAALAWLSWQFVEKPSLKARDFLLRPLWSRGVETEPHRDHEEQDALLPVPASMTGRV